MAEEPIATNTDAQTTSNAQASTDHPQLAASQMAKIVLDGDGQEFDIPLELVETDAILEDALAGAYPDIRGARIERNNESGKLVINVTKRSGPKGSVAAAQLVLRHAPRHVNPAVALCLQLRELESAEPLSPEVLVTLDATIRQAIEEGEAEGKEVAAATAALARIPSLPSLTVPAGF